MRVEGGLVFGATSGLGDATVASLADTVQGALPGPDSDEEPWDSGGGGLKVDRDAAERVGPERAARWLEAATATIGTWSEAWVEVAATLESWAVGEVALASRSRFRAWALARPAKEGAPPVLIAARSWERLPEDGWQGLLGDRVAPGESPPGLKLPRSCCALFGPESSAVLVQALVRALHADSGQVGLSVGPGWRLFDDPTAEGSLFGGTFDDSGFSTRRTELADGRSVKAAISGPAFDRRPSFRDPPASHPAHLVVEGSPEQPPATCVLVSGLTVHPLEPSRWILQFQGALLADGLPVARIAEGYFAASPLEMVQNCIGTVGGHRDSHLGVRTPALLIEHLSLA